MQKKTHENFAKNTEFLKTNVKFWRKSYENLSRRLYFENTRLIFRKRFIREPNRWINTKNKYRFNMRQFIDLLENTLFLKHNIKSTTGRTKIIRNI